MSSSALLPPPAVLPSVSCRRHSTPSTNATENRLRTGDPTRVHVSAVESDPLSATLTVSIRDDALARHFCSSLSPPSLSLSELKFQSLLSELKKLRSVLQSCVGRRGKHCKQCKGIAQYLKLFWETPRLTHRSWVNDRGCLRVSVLVYFFEWLLELTQTLIALVQEGCEENTRCISIMTKFLQPSDAKDTVV